MRSLAIALFVAWITVGLELFLLPSTLLEMEVTASREMLESMKTSPLADIPETQQYIDFAKQLVADPSVRRITLWVMWSALFLLVAFGLWTAYATIRRRNYAMALVVIGSLLFLARQAIFRRTAYELLLDDFSPILWWLKNGYYQFAISSIWYDYVLPLCFLMLTVVGLIYLGRKWLRSAQPI